MVRTRKTRKSGFPGIPRVVKPQESLVPLTGDFFVTPSEPADPRDCDRYPSSPFCGGMPFDLAPLSLGPAVVFNNCNIGIQFEPTLFYTKLPAFQAVYRFPDPQCRREKKPRLFNPEDPKPLRGLRGLNLEDDEIIYFFVTGEDKGLIREVFNWSRPDRWKTSYRTYHQTYKFIEAGFDEDGIAFARVQGNYKTKVDDVARQEGFRNIDRTGNVITYRLDRYTMAFEPGSPYIRSAGGYSNPRYDARGAFLASAYYSNVEGFFSEAIDYEFIIQPPNYPPRFIRRGTKIPTVHWVSKGRILPPPPPKNPKKRCCMGCCKSSGRNRQNDYSRKILTKLKKIEEIVGCDDFPVSVPRSLIEPSQEFADKLKKFQGNTSLKTIPQFIKWTNEQIHAVLGQFHQTLEIEDTDLVTKDDQSATVVLPNIAETLAELTTLVLDLQTTNAALINICTRALIETGLTKQQAIKALMYSRANAEFLGYEGKETTQKVPFLFSLPDVDKEGNATDESLISLLQNSQEKVKVWEMKGEKDLNDKLATLEISAGIIKAVFSKGIDLKGDLKAQLKNALKGSLNLLDYGVANKTTPPPDSEGARGENFDAFLQSVETGFISSPGTSETERPYGKDFTQRPRVREVGNQSNQGEGQT